MKKPLAVGIDLGTTTCRLAWLPDQKPPPAVLGRPVPAWQAAGLESDPGPAWGHSIPQRKSDPVQILRSLREKAGAELGAEVLGAVITHPAYKGSQERENLRQAALLAGFSAVRLVSEPAAIVFGQRERLAPGQVVLVYSLGAGPLTVSVYRQEGNNLIELDTRPDKELSGHALTVRLARALSREYQQRIPDSSYVGSNDWERTAEQLKCQLSQETEATCTLPPQALPATRQIVPITRLKLEEFYGPLIADSLKLCNEVLAGHNLSRNDLSGVWLEGGCKAIPLIQRQLGDWFGRGILILDDHAVALGAAGQTLYLEWPREEETPVLSPATLLIPGLQKTVVLPQGPRVDAAQNAARPPILDAWASSEQHIQAGNHEGALAAIQEAKKLLERQEARAIFVKAQTLERQALAEPSAGGPPSKPEDLLAEAIKAYEQAFAKDPLDEYQKGRDAAKRALDLQKARQAYSNARDAGNKNDWITAKKEYRRAYEIDPSQSDYKKYYLDALYRAITDKLNPMAKLIQQIGRREQIDLITRVHKEVGSLVLELEREGTQNPEYSKLVKDYRKFIFDYLHKSF